LLLIDVSSPDNPVLVGEYDTVEWASALAIRGRYAYAATYDGIDIIDVADKSAPQLVKTVAGDRVLDVAVIGNYLYAFEYGDAVVYDLTDPVAPAFVTTYRIRIGSYSHAVQGGFLYVAVAYGAYTSCELIIADVRDPAQPSEVGRYAFPGGAWDVAISQHLAYVAVGYAPNEKEDGLYVLDVSKPTEPMLVGTYPVTGATGLAVAGDTVYLRAEGYLQVVSVIDPSDPVLVDRMMVDNGWGSHRTPVYAMGEYVYLGTDSGRSLKTMTVKLASTLETVTEFTLIDEPRDFASRLDGYLYVSTGSPFPNSDGGVCIFSVPPLPDIDIGFRPDPHGYNFANYPEWSCWWNPLNPDCYPNLLADIDLTTFDMRDMFGDDAVCATFVGNYCIPMPKALIWLTIAKAVMNGGHCYGMAVTSSRFFTGKDHPGQFQPPAQSTHDLWKLLVRRHIAKYFVSQAASPISEELDAAFQSTPDAVLLQLHDLMSRDSLDPPVLELKSRDDKGHAVTPYAIEHAGDNTYWVRIYDNQSPDDTNRYVIIDTDANTWSYQFASGGMLL